jgi:integrase/recombinase XerD
MGEITLRQALDEFKAIYLPARNYARRTRTEYLSDIKELVAFLENAGVSRVGDVNLPHLERYQAEMDNRGLTGSTRKRKTISIRTFFNFLHSWGYVSINISDRLIPPFSENPIPRVLTQAEYQRLLAAYSPNIRDTAIIEMLLQTGIRLSELILLKTQDINLPEDNEMGMVRIVGGGGRRGRNLPLNSKACQAVKAYLQTQNGATNTNIFVNRFGKPLGARGVQKMVQKRLARAGIHDASVHSLRHTFAVQQLIKGTSAKTIQEVLGHQDIRTTEIYVALAREAVSKELEENAL